MRKDIEEGIRYANITIIRGTGASQYVIGAVSARLVEAVLRDERAVLPVAAYNPDFDVTLSLVSVLGAGGVVQMHPPRMSPQEHAALDQSVPHSARPHDAPSTSSTSNPPSAPAERH